MSYSHTMTISIRFLGAVETVTGSRFLLENGSHKVLVDAGLYQGLKELRRKNWDPLPIRPSEISTVVITHAHLDHCGYLPKLVAQGFKGVIHATEYTKQLAEIVLKDSASLQVEDAKYAKKKGYSRHENPQPLYSLEDAQSAISKIQIQSLEPLALFSLNFKIQTNKLQRRRKLFHYELFLYSS